MRWEVIVNGILLSWEEGTYHGLNYLRPYHYMYSDSIVFNSVSHKIYWNWELKWFLSWHMKVCVGMRLLSSRQCIWTSKYTFLLLYFMNKFQYMPLEEVCLLILGMKYFSLVSSSQAFFRLYILLFWLFVFIPFLSLWIIFICYWQW